MEKIYLVLYELRGFIVIIRFNADVSITEEYFIS